MAFFRKLRLFTRKLGPGFVTGASDDDPSGIATYSQTGAQFGYSHLWTSFFTFPLMTAVQEMCGRIGLVARSGLAKVIKEHYSKKVLFLVVSLLALANTVNVGANLGAMAESAKLVLGWNFTFLLVLITLICISLPIFIGYRTYEKVLKYLSLSLFAYVVTAFLVKQDWSEIFTSFFIPSFSFDKESIMNIVAILGTTLSPYLFFWESSQEVEEERVLAKNGDLKKFRLYGKYIQAMRKDTLIGMLFSNLIMFFIMITAASALRGELGITNIDNAADAAKALGDFAGNGASLIFAFGILGVGLLSVPVLAGSVAYAVAEGFDKVSGLNTKFHEAKVFYSIMIFSILIGVIINFSTIPAFKLLYYTAVLNGLCAPPLILMILLIANNKKIMGHHVNGKLANIMGSFAFLLMLTSSIIFVVFTFIN